MATKTVDVSEAQVQLQEFMPLLKAGIEVVLTEGNTPVARLVPIGQPSSTRVPGLHPGAFWKSEDFDEPLPDEFWTGST